MTITTVAIGCDVGLPNNTEFTASQLEFTLSGPDYDTLSNDSIPAATVVVNLDGSGVATANLWPVDRGTRNTFYTVVLIGSRTINGQVTAQRFTLGAIRPPAAGAPHALADLLAQSSGGIVVGSTIYETLADAVAAALAAAAQAEINAAAGADPIAAQAAAAAAIAAAAQAALYDGPWVDNVTALLADTALTYTAGQPGTVAAGDIVRTRAEGFAYSVALSGAVDNHVTTAGGVRLYVDLSSKEASVEAFGVGQAGVDVGAAMQLICDLVTAGEIYKVEFSGLYDCDATLTVNDAFARFEGKVGRRCGLRFVAVDGIVWDNSGITNVRGPVVFENIALLSSFAGGFTALDFTGKTGVQYNTQLTVDTADFGRGFDGGYWLDPLVMRFASQSTVRNSNFSGGGVNTRGNRAITAIRSNAVVINQNNTIIYYDDGIYNDGSGGMFVSDNHILACLNGVVKTGTENYLDVSHNHFACALRNVWVQDVGASGNHNTIVGNFSLIFLGMTSVTDADDFIGFDIASDDNTIMGNDVLRTGSTARQSYGVIFRGTESGTRTAKNNRAIGNSWNALTFGVKVETGAQTNAIYDNTGIGFASEADLLVNNGANTRYRYQTSARAATVAREHEFRVPEGTAVRVLHTTAGTDVAAGIELVSHVSGGVPIIRPFGDAADLSLTLRPKGTGQMLLQSSAGTARVAVNSTGLGFFGVAPVARPSVGAAATDAATTQTLANNLRTALISLGLAQA